MTTKEARIEALERVAGTTAESEEEATARALQEMPIEELVLQVREIIAKYDGAEDIPADVQQAKKDLTNYDARLAWEKEHWGQLPDRNAGKVRP